MWQNASEHYNLAENVLTKYLQSVFPLRYASDTLKEQA